jgi:hypothetical protein
VKHNFSYILGLFFVISACATTPSPTPAPVACPPSLTAPIAPQPSVPAAADVDIKDTDEARQKADIYLTYVSDLAAWGREGWARATNAKNHCERAKP